MPWVGTPLTVSPLIPIDIAKVPVDSWKNPSPAGTLESHALDERWMPNGTKPNRFVGAADSGGVIGAVFAALCCAGTPLIVSALAALGLSFLRQDRILWPLMLASLAVALWGFWQGRRMHGSAGPFLLGLAGAAALTAGVIFVHGFPAMELIAAGAVTLVVATIWNIAARRSCTTAAVGAQ